MRTLSEAMTALLKSRKQIGANKPSYSLAISGLTSGIDWASIGDTWRQPKSTIDSGGISIEVKTNGKLIACGMVGDTVYEGEVADVDTLLGADNTVTGWVTTGITTNTYGSCHVFSADGELWLAVNQLGSATLNASLRLYKSPSGNGGDWTLYSTVYSNTTGDSDFISTASACSKILVLPTGRYVLGVNQGTIAYSVYRQSSPTIYISDDNGEHWTSKFSPTVTNSLYSKGPISSEIARLDDGTLFWCWGLDYADARTIVVRSDDDGSNWTSVYDIIDELKTFGGTFHVDNDELYLFASGYESGLVSIAKLTQPKIDGTLDWLDTQPPLRAVGGPIILTDIGGRIILIGGEYVLGFDTVNVNIPTKSISINRNKNMAASLDILIDNKDGAWAPDGTTHSEILWPNKVVTLQQGYGTDLVTTFTGLIDRIQMTSFPQEIIVSCRDYMKYLLDQLVTKAVEGGNTHILQYTSQTVEAIVTDLVTEAGLTLAETIYTTGITVDDITFSWCSWADAIQELADLVGADFGCDETGKFYFRKDYIADTPTIAYIFKEGEDILSLSYEINDADIYQKVVCYGTKTDGTSCFAQTNYTSRVYYNVLPNKYMKIDAGSAAQTAEAAQLLTNRAEILMRSRVRICQFAAVAVPQLQIGDVIQVIETSSTISEAYRVTDLSTTMDDTYTMMITCYHHSYTE